MKEDNLKERKKGHQQSCMIQLQNDAGFEMISVNDEVEDQSTHEKSDHRNFKMGKYYKGLYSQVYGEQHLHAILHDDGMFVTITFGPHPKDHPSVTLDNGCVRYFESAVTGVYDDRFNQLMDEVLALLMNNGMMKPTSTLDKGDWLRGSERD